MHSPTGIIDITREGPRLFVKMMGQDRLELFAEGERDFFFKVADAQITFAITGEGPVRVAIWHQDGEDQRGERQKQLVEFECSCHPAGFLPPSGDAATMPLDHAS